MLSIDKIVYHELVAATNALNDYYDLTLPTVGIKKQEMAEAFVACIAELAKYNYNIFSNTIMDYYAVLTEDPTLDNLVISKPVTVDECLANEKYVDFLAGMDKATVKAALDKAKLRTKTEDFKFMKIIG